MALTPVQSSDMRRLQLWIVLLTVLTLPGYGLAGIAHVRSCQLQMAAAQSAAVPGDCCPGKSDSGTPCKAGYNCKSPQSYEPTHLAALLIVPARPSLTAHPPTLPVSHSINGLWRPPRLI